MPGSPSAATRRPARRRDRALEIIADAFLSLGTPVQHGVAALLASRHIAEDAIRERTYANLEHARLALTGSPASVLDVEGGWYATLRLPRTRSEEAWALVLLEDDATYVHPGHFFDFETEAFLVVGLLTPASIFREGLVRVIIARVARE